MNVKIAAFYSFINLKPEYLIILEPLIKVQLSELHILGTILLAEEGINGTIAGDCANIDKFLIFLETINEFKGLDIKLSFSDVIPFKKCKVKTKKEILTFGEKNCNPGEKTGIHVSPQEWNNLISNPDTCIIDVRNNYEVESGSFPGAIDPKTINFTDFKDFVKINLHDKKEKKIAMFCTGGIRCEKASTFMMNEGFNDVYQLDGGILKYLELQKDKENLWKGTCFIFDERRELLPNLSATSKKE